MKNFFKKVALHTNRSVFNVLLILLPSAFLFTFIFSQPPIVKKMLRDSGLYKVVSDTVVNGLATDQFTQQVAAQGISVDTIHKAAKKTVSSGLVEKKFEAIIDSTYDWLYGRTDKLSVNLDLRKETNQFSTYIAQDATQQIAQKPICTQQQLLDLSAKNASSLDTLSITTLPCRPENLNIDALKAQFSSTVETTQQMTTQTDPSAAPQNTTVALNQTANVAVPIGFRIMTVSFYISVVMAIVSLLLFWLLLRDRQQFFAIVGKSTLVSGVLLVVYALASQWIIQQLPYLMQGGSSKEIQTSLRPFASVSIATLLWCGGGYIVTGILLFVAKRRYSQSSKVSEATPPVVQPVPSVTAAPQEAQVTPVPLPLPPQEVIGYNKEHDRYQDTAGQPRKD